jgi:predicted acyl esterase
VRISNVIAAGFGLLVGFAAWVASASALELPEKSNFTGSEAWVPLRDGKRLAADVYLPKSAQGPAPTILIQTPYLKSASRGSFADPEGGRNHALAGTRDYAIVITDWRGRGASIEALTPESTPGGTEDGFDTIEWIVAQPWCNGKVGTWGPSALGRVQYMTARGHHPNHVCAVPFVMPLNLNYDCYFPGGALWEEFVGVLRRLGWDRRSWLVENPVNGEFWRELERTTFTQPSEMQIPMLIYGGWFDIYADGVIETFQAIRAEGGEKARSHSRLMMGPRIHAATEPVEQGELAFENAAFYGARRAV